MFMCDSTTAQLLLKKIKIYSKYRYPCTTQTSLSMALCSNKNSSVFQETKTILKNQKCCEHFQEIVAIKITLLKLVWQGEQAWHLSCSI